MTRFQIISLCVLLAALAWQFLPAFKLPALPSLKKKDATLAHLEAVIRIRDVATSAEVQTACNALLQALLK